MMKTWKRLLAGLMVILVVVLGTPKVSANGFTDLNDLAAVLESDFVYVVDFDNGQVLTEKNGYEKMYPASMTKLMTVLLAIEHFSDWDEMIKITPEAVENLGDATVIGYWPDDTQSVRDLIYASMMVSAADATNALGIAVSGSVPAFVEAMNAKAKELGMDHTHFMNTSGMHDENHYSTCEDIAKLLKACTENEDYRTVMDREEYTISGCYPYPDGYELESSAWYYADEYSIPGFRGGKAGYTGMAGHCLASWEVFGGMNLGIIVAHADTDYYEATHYEETAYIARYLYERYARTEIDVSHVDFGTVRVHRLLTNDEVPIVDKGVFVVDAPKDRELSFGKVNFKEGVTAAMVERTVKGTVGAYDGDSLVYETEVSVIIPAEKNPVVGFFAPIGGMATAGIVFLALIWGVMSLWQRRKS